MTAQTLFTHRLVFYQQRGFLQTAMARSLSRLENHFQDYTKDPERSQAFYDIAAAVRETTGKKVQIVVPWRLLPAVCLVLESHVVTKPDRETDAHQLRTASSSIIKEARRIRV
jgi:hypothetical protein